MESSLTSGNDPNETKIITHNSKKRYQETQKPRHCKICGVRLASRGSWWLHNRAVHQGEKNHLCSKCPSRFSTSTSLKRHEARHMANIEKSFICQHCGKQFAVNEKLKNHERIHTGDKPYNCELCGEKFRIRDLLNIHMRQHTGEKPYKCGKCKKTFTSNQNLRYHQNKLHPNHELDNA